MKPKKFNNDAGFTLIELLIVMTIISVLAAVIFVAVDPVRRLAEARNSSRWSEVRSILEAVLEYATDNSVLPSGIDTTLRMLGTATGGCTIACGGLTFIDDESAEFAAGTMNNTQWDSGNNWLELTAAGQALGSGDFSSNVKDAGSIIDWNVISWLPQRPLYKELPNSSQSESGYPTGNANLTGNQLLMHLNDVVSSTSFADTSGNGNNGSCAGATCPTAGVSGKLNTATSFDGVNDAITTGLNVDQSSGQLLTICAWAYPASTSAGDHDLISTDNGGYDWSIDRLVSTWRLATGSAYWSTGVSVDASTWQHVCGVWDASNIYFYKNGVSTSLGSGPGYDTSDTVLTIGRNPGFAELWDGRIDEVAVYNRALSATEISDLYKRGALRLNLQVRSCDDSACVGESFIGPNGATSTYYSELASTSVNPPTMALINVSSTQYFQYKAFFETDNVSLSPELKSVTVGYSGGAATNDVCLDLRSSLVDDYLSQMPVDERFGDDTKTYYAIRSRASGRAEVIACGAELGESISVTR
ncbi:hypothetical protein A3D72_02440 [Candidatus Uhrbacteria bacterium RIFCSPHIGHO2_02_FULL_57_19]|uniref:LamG-like jellyroll fold domain-containing protein n=1 Tax=Candidatus Uhrbacteria bacterium RIFCSPHIGHO2_02_FULL_57_19 TaxID=1802391 RepID=A0A1F7U455_9BACT|nr:MAG: hypothetical protein A3D72_02440 [Candidatus Uhrbacteria bacterium RIFCSPHIGHO2_02_FULL_57_19]